MRIPNKPVAVQGHQGHLGANRKCIVQLPISQF